MLRLDGGRKQQNVNGDSQRGSPLVQTTKVMGHLFVQGAHLTATFEFGELKTCYSRRLSSPEDNIERYRG